MIVLTINKNMTMAKEKLNVAEPLKGCPKGKEDCPVWTIKDAVDGDIISYDSGWTCIFKRIHGVWFSSHCFITSDGEFLTGYDKHAIDSEINGNAHPATKEQCNLFFQKMKEAGYKWNQETKTLEKVD